jgi:hypothetical protein
LKKYGKERKVLGLDTVTVTLAVGNKKRGNGETEKRRSHEKESPGKKIILR